MTRWRRLQNRRQRFSSDVGFQPAIRFDGSNLEKMLNFPP